VINFKCSKCQELLQASESIVSEILVCPKCGQRNIVPDTNEPSVTVGLVTIEQLNLAAWLSIISAALSIPLFLFGFYRGEQNPFSFVVSILMAGIAVYILVIFKKLLNNRFNFRKTDSLIMFVIMLNIAGVIIAHLPGSIVLIGILYFICFGIVNIAFGIKLLDLPNNLYGLLKPFSYGLIILGLCSASIIGVFLALLVSMVLDVILAMIFFRSAKGEK